MIKCVLEIKKYTKKKRKKNVFIGSTAKNGFQIRIVQQKIHNVKMALFLYVIKGPTRVQSFWSRSLRSGTLRSRSFGSEAKFGHFGRGHYGPGYFGRGHFLLYFRH